MSKPQKLENSADRSEITPTFFGTLRHELIEPLAAKVARASQAIIRERPF
jgi:hypothetical protein